MDVTEGLWCLSLCRPLRQQDGVWNSWHRLAAAANLPQGDAEEDSPEHPVRVLPPRVRRPPLGGAGRIFTFSSLLPRLCVIYNLAASWFEGRQGVRGHSRVFSSGCACWFSVCIFFFCQKVCIDSFNVFPSVYSKFHLCSYLFVYVTAIFPPLLFHTVSVCCSNQDNTMIVA